VVGVSHDPLSLDGDVALEGEVVTVFGILPPPHGPEDGEQTLLATAVASAASGAALLRPGAG
jgi:hypothetical protein